MIGFPDAPASLAATEEPRVWQDIHFSSRDGLALYGRRYKAEEPRRRPLLCLPGLTRNSRDFHVLAVALAGHPRSARDVYCLDFRGRGRSAHDRDWRNYTPYVELLDTLDFMTVAGLDDTAVLGTSRGGIVLMLMAALRPAPIRAAILNDIGPVIEPPGLARIMAYVGRTPAAASWREAAALIRQVHRPYFPKLPDQEWDALARQWFEEKGGRPVLSYDKRLAKAFSQIDLGRGLPDTWPQFLALSNVPTLVIRGETSDLLGRATLSDMQARHPRLRSVTVEAQGHAPLLRDEETVATIADFLAEADAAPAPGQLVA